MTACSACPLGNRDAPPSSVLWSAQQNSPSKFHCLPRDGSLGVFCWLVFLLLWSQHTNTLCCCPSDGSHHSTASLYMFRSFLRPLSLLRTRITPISVILMSLPLVSVSRHIDERDPPVIQGNRGGKGRIFLKKKNYMANIEQHILHLMSNSSPLGKEFWSSSSYCCWIKAGSRIWTGF